MVKANFSLTLNDESFAWEVVNPFGDRAAMEQHLNEFCQLYAQRPFDNTGGILFGSAFAYYYFLKTIHPKTLIESGIWRGFSTWIADSALPNTNLMCLDPVLMMPLQFEADYRPARAGYSTQDFSCMNFYSDLTDQACVFFDDHQNVMPRLEQTMNYGIKDVILDDNQYEPTYHESITHLIKQNHPVLPLLFSHIEEYYLFPPLIPPVAEGCPVQPIWDAVPGCLQALNLDLEEELRYTWVTYLRLKPKTLLD